MFIERVADNGSPDLQSYGSNLAFIQKADINKNGVRMFVMRGDTPPFVFLQK